MVIDLGWQKKWDPDPKSIQQIEIVRQVKYEDSINANGAKSVYLDLF